MTSLTLSNRRVLSSRAVTAGTGAHLPVRPGTGFTDVPERDAAPAASSAICTRPDASGTSRPAGTGHATKDDPTEKPGRHPFWTPWTVERQRHD